MARTREWMKFGVLTVVTFTLAVAFAGAVASPRQTPAEQSAAALEVLATPQPAPIPPAAVPAADMGDAFVAVAEIIRPAVVYINSEVRQEARSQVPVPRGFEDFFPDQNRGPQIRTGQGSGFIISADGFILTNNHVVDHADKLTVTLYDKRVFEARVVGTDAATDVAVIKIDATDLPTASLGNSDSVRVGEWVLAVGNPLGRDFTFTVTAGIVSARGRSLNSLPIASEYRVMDFIQTDAAINPGNSGGPLVNIRGQVVGINSAIASQNGYYQGYGFAIPVNLVRVVSNQLIAAGKVTRSILGISIDEITQEDADYVGLDDIRGVVVADYSLDNSPAEQAGIRRGDIIIELDGEPVYYVAQLQQNVAFRTPGETVDVTVARRGGERVTISVRLTAAPSDIETVALAEPTEPTDVSGHETKLGIAVRPMAEELVNDERLTPDQIGLQVVEVDIDSPGRDRLFPAGARTYGDVITHVNGQRVRTIEDFDEALRATGAGDVVSLQVYNPQIRSGGSRFVRLRIGQ
jgi:serine protease Do